MSEQCPGNLKQQRKEYRNLTRLEKTSEVLAGACSFLSVTCRLHGGYKSDRNN